MSRMLIDIEIFNRAMNILVTETIEQLYLICSIIFILVSC